LSVGEAVGGDQRRKSRQISLKRQLAGGKRTEEALDILNRRERRGNSVVIEIEELLRLPKRAGEARPVAIIATRGLKDRGRNISQLVKLLRPHRRLPYF